MINKSSEDAVIYNKKEQKLKRKKIKIKQGKIMESYRNRENIRHWLRCVQEIEDVEMKNLMGINKVSNKGNKNGEESVSRKDMAGYFPERTWRKHRHIGKGDKKGRR